MRKKQEWKTQKDLEILRGMLGLVSKEVSVEVLSGWTEEQRELAAKWAAKTHLRASDNIVRVPPCPEHVRKLLDVDTTGIWPVVSK